MSFHSLCSTVQRTFASSSVRRNSPQGFARLFGGSVLLAFTALTSLAQSTAKPHLQPNFGKVPLSFEANRGQVDARVQFLSRGPGYALFLTPGEAVLELHKGKLADVNSTLRMKLQGANASASATGKEVLPGTANYFFGSDPKKWQTAIDTFKRVQYTAVYPGIDLVYYGNQRELEYDFVVAPHADPSQIALSFTGAAPKIDKTGDLVLAANTGETRFHKPVVYQLDGDRKTSVDARYDIAGGKVTFALGTYDHSKELVIDPILSYLTYLGGSFDDTLNGIAIDASGSAYVVGTTTSANFPLKNAYTGALPGGTNGNRSMFVTKFNTTGTALVYSTYLGGTGNTYGTGIAVDTGGNAYVVGTLDTDGYPITAGAFQTLCGANYVVPAGSPVGVRANGCTGAGQGDNSGVVTKINATGTALVYSTYLSGNNYNSVNAVAVNAAGEAYVVGVTNSFCSQPPYNANGTGYQPYDCFPTTAGAAQVGVVASSGGGVRNFSFFTKLDAAGANILYSSLLGPNNINQQSITNALAVAVDPAGMAYIGGYTSNNLLTTPGSYQPSIGQQAGGHAFVAKFDPTAAKLVYSTFLTPAVVAGGNGDQVNSIAADAAGNAYLAGNTSSCGFPTTPGVYQPQASFPPGSASSCNAGFVSKLNPTGSALVWSTFVGNNSGPNVNNSTFLTGLALASDGSVYVAGSESGYGIQTVNPVIPQSQTATVGYVAHIDATASTLLFATTIGGTVACSELATGLAVDPTGNMYVAGVANGCTTLPTTPGAFQATGSNPGANVNDGWVAKIAPTINTTTTLAVSPIAPTFGQAVTLTATVAGVTGNAKPTGPVTFLNGSTTLGTGTLNASGVATFTTSTLAPNTYSLTATYSGDPSFSASASTAQTLSIAAPATTTALTLTPATATLGQTVTLSAKVTPASGTTIPTGTVTFKNGATVLSAVAVDATGTATFATSTLGVGTYTITALYSGDATFATSTSAAQTLTITTVGSTTALTVSPTTALIGQAITFTAKASPGSGTKIPTGTIAFNNGTTTLSTVPVDATGSATFTSSTLAVGTYTVTAVYSGDTTYSASTSTSATLAITAPVPNFSVSFNPTSSTVMSGQIATTTLTVTPINGFTGAVTLSCTNLPAHTLCTFAPPGLTVASGPVSSTLTITTGSSLGGALRNAPLDKWPGTGSAVFLALLAWTSLRTRKVSKRLQRLLLVFVMLGAATAGLVGCGSSTSSATPAGAYSVNVTVAAGATTHTGVYTLTVQ